MATVRFEVVSIPVGEGGFGKVRRGKDTILERDIAIKSLDPIMAKASPTDRERFHREAKTLAKLSHPHIPAIFDVVMTESEFHIIFQFIEGNTIRKVLEGGPLPLNEALLWLDQIASALEHAHALGILHRDIKPENMIVSLDKKHCYLLDFGISLSKADIGRLTKTDRTIGTPGYMSPEQEGGKDLDSSDDIFVLGLCLYEVLAGNRLAPGDYKQLTLINQAIPAALDQLIQDCIAPKGRRISEAKEFRRRLALVLSSSLPLSDILADGRLHDVIFSIRDMTAESFMAMPAGQRLLVLGRFFDIETSTEPGLIAARREFLRILPRIAINLPISQFTHIMRVALSDGFELKQEFGHVGDERIREALAKAAVSASQSAHAVLADTVIEWLRGFDLKTKDRWFYHAARELLQHLMANPACGDKHAEQLADFRQQINEIHQQLRSTGS